MNDAQTCDLCAGECRGHSLGRPEQWEPEVGSLAHAQAIFERLTDAQKRVLLQMRPGVWHDPVYMWVCGVKSVGGAMYQLHKKGFVDRHKYQRYSEYRLNATGLSVRKLLEKQNG